jgi:hypothetical protein
MNLESSTAHFSGQLPICQGCAEVATSLGITLTEPHRSCRRVTVENIAEAARQMGVPFLDMFKAS